MANVHKHRRQQVALQHPSIHPLLLCPFQSYGVVGGGAGAWPSWLGPEAGSQIHHRATLKIHKHSLTPTTPPVAPVCIEEGGEPREKPRRHRKANIANVSTSYSPNLKTMGSNLQEFVSVRGLKTTKIKLKKLHVQLKMAYSGLNNLFGTSCI